MDMSKIMEQAREFQGKMAEMQQRLAEQRLTATVGGGMVSATVNGKNELLALRIEKEVLAAGDPAMLEDLVIAAVNEAMRRAQDAARSEMAKLTGGLGMNIPGLSNIFG